MFIVEEMFELHSFSTNSFNYIRKTIVFVIFNGL